MLAGGKSLFRHKNRVAQGRTGAKLYPRGIRGKHFQRSKRPIWQELDVQNPPKGHVPAVWPPNDSGRQKVRQPGLHGFPGTLDAEKSKVESPPAETFRDFQEEKVVAAVQVYGQVVAVGLVCAGHVAVQDEPTVLPHANAVVGGKGQDDVSGPVRPDDASCVRNGRVVRREHVVQNHLWEETADASPPDQPAIRPPDSLSLPRGYLALSAECGQGVTVKAQRGGVVAVLGEPWRQRIRKRPTNEPNPKELFQRRSHVHRYAVFSGCVLRPGASAQQRGKQKGSQEAVHEQDLPRLISGRTEISAGWKNAPLRSHRQSNKILWVCQGDRFSRSYPVFLMLTAED